MPRKNKRKPTLIPNTHGTSIFNPNLKSNCYGCAFARGFACMTSDGKCLKIKPELFRLPAPNQNNDRVIIPSQSGN